MSGRVSEPGEATATEQDLADLNKILNERGYLVLDTSASYALGHIVDVFAHKADVVHHPVRVVCETNYGDYFDQCKAMGMRPCNVRKRKFYRVVTD